MNQKDVYQKVTNIILSLLEKASAQKYRYPWIKVDSGKPINAHSKKEYRGINFFLLYIICIFEGYTVNRWLTIKQANELGGRIKKGSKSSPVVLYKKTFFDKDGNKYTPSQVEQMTEPQRQALKLTSKSLLTEYNVFNVAQIEGLPSELYMNANAKELTEIEVNEEAERLLMLSGAKVSYEGNQAYYIPSKDEIVLPPRNQFKGEEGFYSVAFHELTHWTANPNRLNRVMDAEDKKRNYALEELVAELSTAFVCSSLGYSSQLTNNANYLKNWIDILKEDNKVILKVSNHAQKAADYILQPLSAEVEQAA